MNQGELKALEYGEKITNGEDTMYVIDKWFPPEIGDVIVFAARDPKHIKIIPLDNDVPEGHETLDSFLAEESFQFITSSDKYDHNDTAVISAVNADAWSMVD